MSRNNKIKAIISTLVVLVPAIVTLALWNVLKAELENGLLVLVTHFGLCIDEQENAVKTILENIRDEKCILMGDFNVTPDNELLSPIKAKMKDTSLGFCENKKGGKQDSLFSKRRDCIRCS